jgi:fumarylacetoacetase
MIELDHTHRADAVSWVDSAQYPDTDFPIQNLPLGVFRRGEETPRIGIAIGMCVLDLQRAFSLGLLSRIDDLAAACGQPHLNALMALGRPAARRLRRAVFDLLAFDSDARRHADALLVGRNEVKMLVPAQIGDFTDFFTSIHHARRTGEMFRPDMPLQPNFKHLPVAYHGRASSVVPSGTPCVRPCGQTGSSPGGAVYAPTQRLDFELEVGFYIGPGNALGAPVAIDDAEQQAFGLCLVNDWSARDIQRWESQPLGPFLAKSFMTSVSPWVVTLDALAPFRCAVPPRAEDEPAVSGALSSKEHTLHGGIDIALSVRLQTGRMRSEGQAPVPVARPDFVDQYWSIFQMLTHHASNGCNLRSGDLLSSGTVSGPERENSGCLLELTNNGKEPLVLPNGESRSFLEDGDMVEFSGRCRRDGYRSIGFGACRATVAPAVKG